MAKQLKYTREQVANAIEGASSQSEVIKNLGLNVNNGNYESVRYYAKHYNLELPTWNPSNSTERAILRNKLSNDEWFMEDTRRSGPSTRKRLIELGFEDKCECGQGPEWNGKPLTLQIDHIDGNKFNNRIENLRIICPNCHTQTETYSNTSRESSYNYCRCGKQVHRDSKQCRDCESKSRVGKTSINFPELDDLVDMMREKNYLQVSKLLGCSDNAIRKHLKRNGINPKTLEAVTE